MTSFRGLFVRALVATTGLMAIPLAAQQGAAATERPDTVRIRMVDVDVRAAVQLLGQYLDRPIVIGSVSGGRVTLETPGPVRRSEVLGLLRATLETQGLEVVAESAGPYRVRQRAQPEAPPQPSFTPVQGSGGTRLFVIRLNHARAADVAATVNALYGRSSAFGDVNAYQPSTLPQQLRQSQVPPAGSPLPAAPQLAAPGAALSGETVIIPDAGTNSLLVRATAADFALIEAAVKEVDVRPLQVLIEVIIAEVRRDRALSFGVDIALPKTPVPGHPGTVVDGAQKGLAAGLGDLVLNVMGIGGDRDLEATLRAAASRGDVTIVSRPAVIAANNERAEILVGSQRPFVQVSRSLPTDVPTRDQVVQYKDVGTKLSVRPTISSDGYVMLQVSQEVNAATSEYAFDAPVISTRAVQTELLLKNGQTVVIGGLTDRQHEATQQGVPILSSIPWIGGFFGRAVRRTTETELFLFITPRLIRTDADADAITAPLKKRATRATH